MRIAPPQASPWQPARLVRSNPSSRHTVPIDGASSRMHLRHIAARDLAIGPDAGNLVSRADAAGGGNVMRTASDNFYPVGADVRFLNCFVLAACCTGVYGSRSCTSASSEQQRGCATCGGCPSPGAVLVNSSRRPTAVCHRKSPPCARRLRNVEETGGERAARRSQDQGPVDGCRRSREVVLNQTVLRGEGATGRLRTLRRPRHARMSPGVACCGD